MEAKELLEVYKELFETWRFQVNSHWQRSGFFSAFETVALAGCWKLFSKESDPHSGMLAIVLAILGIVLTFVWLQINIRTHRYALYWLEAVGEVEEKIIQGGGESGIDFARKILDDRRSSVRPSRFHHYDLELTVPWLFQIAWVALLILGACHSLAKGYACMHGLSIYNLISLAIAIFSLLVSLGAVLVARSSLTEARKSSLIADSSLSQAKQVAERDQRDWKQRKWFDLYLKADESRDLLERFQALYPAPNSPNWNTPQWQQEWNGLMLTMRTVHRIASVFPQDPAITAFFNATGFEDPVQACSAERLHIIADAVEGIRQKALVEVSVL